ncbi:MAG: hypothetical protein II897_04195 [Clostridia bacterium]|nr:hypothetical protein [Clostridia bacterium]
MKMMIVLTGDEIKERIAYPLICETRYGSRWDTQRRKRRWTQQFSEKERDKASKLFKLAHKWYLVSGVPEEVTMSIDTLALWQKLEGFCASL